MRPAVKLLLRTEIMAKLPVILVIVIAGFFPSRLAAQYQPEFKMSCSL